MKPVAWRNKREHQLVRSEPPHKDYFHLWEPLYTDALQKSAQRVIEAYDFGFRPSYQEAIEALRKELK